jgi:serine/threonine protein kinase
MFESQAIKNILQDIEKIEDEIGNKLSDFEILQVLGQGGFGFVAKVRSKKNLKIYAMKKVDLSKVPEDKKKYYEYENLFMKNLNHPNICRLFSSFRENTNIYMIMEYMDNGDLFTFLKAHIKLKKYIPEEKLWNIFEQCLQGLIYIHSKGIIHRDIKPANILYGSKGECKITDFNVSSVIDKEKAANFTNDEKIMEDIINNSTEVGTPYFKAPEVIYSEYNDKCDVYSLGVTFCTLAYQKFSIPEDEPKLYSKELHDIIELMLSPEDQRPTSKEIYNKFIILYVEKYLHMTGLISCINCLSSYGSLVNFFRDNDAYFESNNFNQKEKEITKQFNKILKVLDQKKNNNTGDSIIKSGEDKFNYLLFELRELLYLYGIKKKSDNS